MCGTDESDDSPENQYIPSGVSNSAKITTQTRPLLANVGTGHKMPYEMKFQFMQVCAGVDKNTTQ